MKQKALISCSHITDNALTNYAQNIVRNMTTNSNFTTPKPTLAVIQGLITLYAAALLLSIDGNKAATANKNAARANLEDSLSSLANYVNLSAANDLVILESSGFNLSKIPTPVGILEAPVLLIHFGNNPGEVSYELSPEPKASNFIILYSPLPAPLNDAEWRSKVVSSSKGILTNLEHKKEHVFKAAATSSEANKRNVYNFSQLVEQYVS